MTYSTDDIAIASALKMNGFIIESVEIDGKRATFHFSLDARPIALEIQMGRRLVDAIQFHQELRRLSSLARSMAKGHENG